MKAVGRFFFRVLALLLLLAVGFPAGGASGRELKTVKIGFPAFSGGFLPFIIARDRGYYRQEGIDLQIIALRGAISIKALIAGSIGYNTTPSVDAIVRTKQPIRYIFVISRGKYTLVANPSLAKSFAQLKGKALGISSFGGSADLVSRQILKEHGLVPNKDVALLQVGPPSPRLTALLSGRIAATLLTAPTDLEAEDKGMVVLANFVAHYPQIALNTMESRIQSKPDEVYRMVKATLEGFLFDRERKEDAITVLMKFLKIKNRAFARRVYENFAVVSTTDGILPDPEKREAIESTMAQAQVKGKIPISQVFDDQFTKQALKDLKKEGWKP